MTTSIDSAPGLDLQKAFDSHAADWVQYVQSQGGALRHAVILHNLLRHLPAGEPPLRIMDAGGGSGEMAADLAALGHRVTLLDFSAPMLAVARSRCEELGASVEFVCSDAWQAASLWQPGSFDVVLCHSLLEFADNPAPLLAQLATLLKTGGVFSVVAGNRHALVMREAIAQGNAVRALQGLDAEIPGNDLFGLPRRTFDPDELCSMIEANGVAIAGEYGVRIFCDLVKTVANWDDLRALELAASSRLPYRRLGRFIQIIGIKQ